jgi:hypothetical protein
MRHTTLATLVILLLVSGCRSIPLFRSGPEERNIAFRLLNNQIVVDGKVGGREGTFLVATAQPETLLAARFGASGRIRVELADGRYSTAVTARSAELAQDIDGILGNDVWGKRVLFIDYAKQLLSVADSGDMPEAPRHRFLFGEIPSMRLHLGSREVEALTDTLFPGAVLAVGPVPARSAIHVDGSSLGEYDIDTAEVSITRVGNTILARYLVGIDFERRLVLLWEDPRYFTQKLAIR